MKKLLLVSFLSALFVLNSYSQVSIGTNATEPNANSILDLQSTDKGLLLPRVALTATDKPAPMAAHVGGMTVYNTATAGTAASAVTPGMYYNDGTKWVRMVPETKPEFFYAPAMVVPTSTTAPEYDAATQTFTLDIYAEYYAQFSMAGNNISATRNPGAGANVHKPYYPLDYFVTYYDNTVFTNVAISDNGILTYKLKPGFKITENTFFNVILKEKK